MKARIGVALMVALTGLAAGAMERMSLDGIWDFRLEKGKSLEEVSMPGFKADSRMTVPGCWDAMSAYYNCRGTGCYRRIFELRKDTPNAFLVVEGMGLRARFWIDGREIGTSVLPWSTFELKTGPLAAGRHEIAAAVDSIVDNSKVKLFWNFYDFYPFGGFYHGVRLDVQDEETEIRRVVVRTRDYKTGLVEMEAQYAGTGPEDFSASVSFDGKAPADVAFKARRATLNVPGFRLWSPSAPNLHTVTVRIGNQASSTRFGIRQVGTADGRITLNGAPVYIKGVNRHEQHWEFGCTTPAQLMCEDILNLKAMGGNFIRGSHYPQCEAFLDLCDELGVLVWEESLGWGNGKDELKDPVFRELQETQTRLMVRNSINHPCIIISGFLNEPASDLEDGRTLIDRLVDVIRAEDSGHLVTFACNHVTCDISNAKTDLIAYNVYPYWYTYMPEKGTTEEMRRNIRWCHGDVVKYFREKYKDNRPIIVAESGVKADYGVRDPLGRAQYTEDFQDEYTRIMLEEILANKELAGIAIWQFTDAKTYTRTDELRHRSYGVNTGGLYDRYRRPKLAVETVRRIFSTKGDVD